jgi:acetolactate synthase-1/2/3 large subunit
LKTYSEYLCDWLVELGYTHCFFVAGGNIMHLLNAARTRFECIPVVHEVTAGISAEYFNELSTPNGGKAFALVTAGPGLTNIVTAIAAAQIESRELLVLGGQVKTSDLSHGYCRQRGIQEIDGVSIVKSISKVAQTLTNPISKLQFFDLERESHTPRKGVVFLEICLDVQGKKLELNDSFDAPTKKLNLARATNDEVDKTVQWVGGSERPVFMIGGGVPREGFSEVFESVATLGIPLMTTWNGADRVPISSSLNWGRPNTWGMRWSNVLIQQSDLIIALGTRLGLQQTGFNWQEFAPLAKIVHVDVDSLELEKGHPKTDLKVQGDALDFLKRLREGLEDQILDFSDWIGFGAKVKNGLPLCEASNNSFEGYWNPYEFMQLITSHLMPGDSLIPSSSGAAETVAMQVAQMPKGSFVVTNKGMASMGYGLAGAIGAAFRTKSRVIHIEGDGGFAQNLQELGTVSGNNLPIKTFILDNGGYASIKMTQKSYFDGEVVGCDKDSGLGLPDWISLFASYGISCRVIPPVKEFSDSLLEELIDEKPRAYLVPIHPDQTYFPKITSKILSNGEMASNPLHLMSPELSDSEIREYLPYLADTILNRV